VESLSGQDRRRGAEESRTGLSGRLLTPGTLADMPEPLLFVLSGPRAELRKPMRDLPGLRGRSCA
jgi:hypothetical protein